MLADCDLIIGTEEEIRIASGADDVLGALKAIRALSTATIVLKRGAMGCIVYDGPITDDLEDGIVGDGFPIEVYNVLGAGDAFMSGFLRGWLKGEPLEDLRHLGQCLRRLRRVAAALLARISDLGRAQPFPRKGQQGTRAAQGCRPQPYPLGDDPARASRTDCWPSPSTIASQLEAVADRLGVPREKIEGLKVLAVEAAARVAKGRPGFGMLLDSTYGRRRWPKAAQRRLLDRPAGRASRARVRSISTICPISAAISSNGRSAIR